MKKLLKTGVVLGLVLATTGCGAIFNGTRQTIQANSSPSGSILKTEPGNLQFTTPASFSLERKNDYVLTFSKEGYAPATFHLQKSMQAGVLILDVLFTGLVGVVVDAATGAWYKLTPEVATVSLEKKIASVEGPDRIEIQITKSKKGVHVEANSSAVQVHVEEED